MPNIIRIRNLEKENNLNDNIILPVDHSTYGTVGKQLKLYQLKDDIFSGITESNSINTSGTSGIDGVIGIDGQSGTSGLISSSGLTHKVRILNYCGECNSSISGTVRYNNSNVEICMQISDTNYEWVNFIHTNTTTTTTTITPTTTTTTTTIPQTTTTTTTPSALVLQSINSISGNLWFTFNSGYLPIVVLGNQYSTDGGSTFTTISNQTGGNSPVDFGVASNYPRVPLIFKIYDYTNNRYSNSYTYNNSILTTTSTTVVTTTSTTVVTTTSTTVINMESYLITNNNSSSIIVTYKDSNYSNISTMVPKLGGSITICSSTYPIGYLLTITPIGPCGGNQEL